MSKSGAAQQCSVFAVHFNDITQQVDTNDISERAHFNDLIQWVFK